MQLLLRNTKLAHILCLFLVACVTCETPQCDGAVSLTEASGVITDGDGDYTEDKECTWTVTAPAGSRVSLAFDSMSTECGWDVLYVYDGSDSSSRLLAALSGDLNDPSVRPEPIVSSGTQIFVHFYSDKYVVASGFDIRYVSAPCPFGCSDHGTCLNGACSCATNYTGIGCQVYVNDTVARPTCAAGEVCVCSRGFTVKDQETWLNIAQVGNVKSFTADISCNMTSPDLNSTNTTVPTLNQFGNISRGILWDGPVCPFCDTNNLIADTSTLNATGQCMPKNENPWSFPCPQLYQKSLCPPGPEMTWTSYNFLSIFIPVGCVVMVVICALGSAVAIRARRPIPPMPGEVEEQLPEVPMTVVSIDSAPNAGKTAQPFRYKPEGAPADLSFMVLMLPSASEKEPQMVMAAVLGTDAELEARRQAPQRTVSLGPRSRPALPQQKTVAVSGTRVTYTNVLTESTGESPNSEQELLPMRGVGEGARGAMPMRGAFLESDEEDDASAGSVGDSDLEVRRGMR